MGGCVKGDVVVIPFPFSDLSGSKRKPVFVVADVLGDDFIVCQITSRRRYDSLAVPVCAADFASGTLPVDSFIRPNKLFTACMSIDTSLIIPINTSPVSPINTGQSRLTRLASLAYRYRPVSSPATSPVSRIDTGLITPIDTVPVSPIDTSPVSHTDTSTIMHIAVIAVITG